MSFAKSRVRQEVLASSKVFSVVVLAESKLLELCAMTGIWEVLVSRPGITLLPKRLVA